MTPTGWIEHRRSGDGERVGWMRVDGDGFVAIDLLGREVTGVVEWLDAESALDELGIGYLADPYALHLPGSDPVRVRILEVSTARILVKKDDFGDINVTRVDFVVEWPIPPELEPLG